MDSPPAPAPAAAAPRPAIAAIFGVAALLVGAAYWSTLVWLWGRWNTDPFYSHGPLVPLVSLALVFHQRRELRLGPSGYLPALLLALAAILHLLGVRLLFEFLSALSIVLVLAAIALLGGGVPLLRSVAFPLLYLLFAIPLPRVVLEKVSVPLQIFSSAASEAVFGAVGAPVTRQGVLLIFPTFTLAVADACSGLRSLITVLAISTLAARLVPATRLRKAGLIAIGCAAALLVNIARITLAGFIGIAFDGDAGAVFFERYSGYFFFALVIFAMAAAFAFLAQERPGAATPPEAPGAPVAPGPVALRVLLPLVLILGLTSGAILAMHAGRSAAPPSRLASWQPALGGWQVSDLIRPEAPPGEEWVRGLLRGGGDRVARFTVIHSVGGRYLHSPEACSLATGWVPERQELREIGTLAVHDWVLRRGPERVLLIFWFDLAGTPVRGSLEQHAGAVWQRLKRGEIDSAYGELVFPLPISADAPVEASLLDLSRSLHAEVSARLWPAR